LPEFNPCPAQVAFQCFKKRIQTGCYKKPIKRRLREAYRKNKRILYDHLISQNIQIVFVVIMRGNSVTDYLTIEKSMREMINKLILLTSKTDKIMLKLS